MEKLNLEEKRPVGRLSNLLVLAGESPTSSKFASPLETFRRPSADVYNSVFESTATSLNLPPTVIPTQPTTLSTIGEVSLSRLPSPDVGMSQRIATSSCKQADKGRQSYQSSPRSVDFVPSSASTCDLNSLWRTYGRGSNPWATQMAKWARLDADHDAFVWINGAGEITQRITFAQIADTVWRLCHFLKNKLGLGVGDRIVLCFPPSLDFIPAFFACLCSGVIAIPVYPPDPTRAKFDCARFHAICESAAVSHVLTNAMYNRVAKFLPTLARDPRWSRLSWWDFQYVQDKQMPGSVFTYDFPSLQPDNVAFLQYTSGSTGLPKGVMVSLGGLLHNCHLCCVSFGFPTCLDDPSLHTSIDEVPFERFEPWFHDYRQPLHQKNTGHLVRVFSWLPVYHDMGLIGFVCTPFLFGGCSMQMSPIDFIKKPWMWMHCVSKYQCICTAGPNFAFELSVRKMPAEIYEQLDLSHVCGVLCGAEPIRRRTISSFVEKFMSRGLHSWALRPAYGLAENTLIVSGPARYDSPVNFVCVDANLLRVQGLAVCRGQKDALLDLAAVLEHETTEVMSRRDDDSPGADGEDAEGRKWITLVSCGRAKQSVDVRIIDAESCIEVPSGRVGEIWIRSPSLARGYFGCAEESRRAFGNVASVFNDREAASPLAEDCTNPDLVQAGGYFRTGDAGFFLHGELFVVGRIKDMLIIRGRNYFPQDIEAEVESIMEVREGCSAAFALEVDGEERLGLAVELRDAALKSGLSAKLTGLITGKQYDEKTIQRLVREIKAKVNESLALDVVALWLCRPKSLAKTSSGKLRRSLIRDTLLAEPNNSNVILAPDLSRLGAAVGGPAAARRVSQETEPVVPSPSRESLYPHPSNIALVQEELSPLCADEPPKSPAETSVCSDRAAPAPTTPPTKREVVHVAIIEAAREAIHIDKFDAEVFDQPLFELGVDSIGVINFVEGLSTRLGRKLETTILFEFPTLQSLEDYLVEDRVENISSDGAPGTINFRANLPLFIFGVACRFPGSSRVLPIGADSKQSTSLGVEDFWDNLFSGLDCITEVPLDRWNVDAYWTAVAEPLTAGKIYTRGGGFIEDAEYFDNEAFRLAPREVEQMDPQQRLALECCVETLWHAGLTEQAVKHKKIGTYFGCCSSDWARLRAVDNTHTASSTTVTTASSKSISVYTSAAFAPSLIANRVSFVLGLTGPSVVMDTACSSSLVALDAAAHHLRDGKCEAALIGGVNMMLTPEVPSMLCKAIMLAKDSRCKTFDVRADGYARGEGVGCVFLSAELNTVRRLGGDESVTPLAVLRGIAVNHGGVAAALTAPNVSAHHDLMAAALYRARISSREIEFIECHGTGTKLGDPVELAAIRAVYGKGRAFDLPLVLGAVKTSIGHLEGAAGIAGVIKAIGVLQRKAVPKNLHLRELNPLLNTDGFPCVFPKETYHLAQDKPRHFASISSFGFGGTNSHAILQRYELGMFAAAHQEDREEPVVNAASLECTRKRRFWNRNVFPWNNLICPMVGSIETTAAGNFVVVTHLRADVTRLLLEHVVHDVPVIPGAALLELLAEVYHSFRATTGLPPAAVCHCQSVEIERPLVLSEVQDEGPPHGLPPLTLVTTINKSTGHVSLSSKYELESLNNSGAQNLTGLISLNDYHDAIPNAASAPLLEGLKELSVNEFYERSAGLGLKVGPRFRTVTSLWHDGKDASKPTVVATLKHVVADSYQRQFEKAFYLHPAVLDGIMQIAALSLAAGAADSNNQGLFVPLRMEGIWLGFFNLQEELICTATPTRRSAKDGDVTVSLFDKQTGRPIVRIDKLQMAQVSFSIPVDIPKDLLWSVEKVPLPSDTTAAVKEKADVSNTTPPAHETWLCLHHSTDPDFTIRAPDHVSIDFVRVGLDGRGDLAEEPKSLYCRVLLLFEDVELENLPRLAVATLTNLVTASKTCFTPACAVVFFTAQPTHLPILQALRRSAEYEWLAGGVGLRLLLCYVQSLQQLTPPLSQSVLDAFGVGELEVEVAEDGSLLVPRLMPVSNNLVGSLCELYVESQSGSLRLRPVSSAALRTPKDDEVEVAVKCAAYIGKNDRRVAGSTHLEDVVGCERIYFSGVVVQAGLRSSYKIGDRVTGEWTPHAPLRSIACVKAHTISDKFLSNVNFESAVVDSLIGLPEGGEDVLRMFRLVDVRDADSLSSLTNSEEDEEEVTVLRFTSVLDTKSSFEMADPSAEAVVISGGLGALGLQTAKWLVAQGVRTIVLLSRSGVLAPETAAASAEWAYLMSSQSQVTIKCVKCDVADASSVKRAFEGIVVRDQLKVVGIVHAAGVLADKAMSQMRVEDLDKVIGPKVTGLVNLHRMCAQYDLESDLRFFVVYSSIAAVIGNLNQTNYAIANAMMDAFVKQRRERGFKCQSIQWGPWLGSGMAKEMDAIARSVGFKPISSDLGLRVLADRLLPSAQETDIVCMPTEVQTFMASRPRKWNFYTAVQQKAQALSPNRKIVPERLAKMSESELYQFVKLTILESARKVIGGDKIKSLDDMPTDVPLTDAGVDSLAAVEFRDEVSEQLGIALSVSTLFDYPALDNLVDYVFNEIKVQLGASPVELAGTKTALLMPAVSSARAAGGYAVVGLACRMPRGSDTEEFWSMLSNQTDCVVEMPLDRFNLDEFYSPEADKPGCAYTRAGAFMDAVDVFDNLFFSISDAEAKLMDPQQRMMLEVTYDSVVDAGLDMKALRKHFTDVAVYIGCCNFDWHYMDANNNPKSGSPFSCTGGSMSLVSNRISYAFGLHGPSMTIDTACSSSLVALDAGREKLDAGTSSGLIVGGVNLMLSPQLFIGFCKTRLLSPDCACRTFDAKANGYVRGEGAAALFLLPVGSMRRVLDDKVYAIVKGSATNHVGRGSTLTAPNGPAQAACISEALLRARKQPGDVVFLEVHGTGTELGDPIEAGAIKTAYADRGPQNLPLLLGAIKTNIGHLEGGAGVAGLLKTILVLHKRQVPPNVHFTTLSPHIDFKGTQFVIPAEKTLSLDTDVTDRYVPDRVCGAVSSFGFGGANAHVVVESLPRISVEAAARGRSCALFFTGQASQKEEMGLSLYSSSPSFHDKFVQLDRIYQRVIASKEFVQLVDPKIISSLPASIVAVVYPTSSEHLSLLETNAVVAQVAMVIFQCALVTHLESLQTLRHVAVLGHSLGEFSMLYALGMADADAVVELVTYRSALVESHSETTQQCMVAAKVSREVAEKAIEDCKLSGQVSVAADNGDARVVLSGTESGVNSLCSYLNLSLSKDAKKLPVSKAYHSPLMRPVVPTWQTKVEAFLKEGRLHPSALTTPPTIYSTVRGRVVTPRELLEVEYWVEHLLHCVSYNQAVQAFIEEKAGAGLDLVEVGPSPVLTRMATYVDPGFKNAFICHDLESDANLDGLLTHRKTKKHLWNGRKHCWMPDGGHHPLAGLGRTLYDSGVRFQTHMRLDVTKFFGDHVVANRAIMPATGFLEMIAVQTAQLNSKDWQRAAVNIYRMEFLQPTLIPPPPSDRSNKFKTSCTLTVNYASDGNFVVSQQSTHTEEDEEEKVVCIGRVRLRSGVTDHSPQSAPSSPKSDLNEGGTTLNCVKHTVALAAVDSPACSSYTAFGFSTASTEFSQLIEKSRRAVDDPALFDAMADVSVAHIPGFYQRLAKKGLLYGPRFRTIRKLVCSDMDTLALIQSVTPDDLGTVTAADLASGGFEDPDFALDRHFKWHPGILDGAFQAIAPLFRNAQSVFVPAVIKHACLRGIPDVEAAQGYWAHASVISKDESSICMTVSLYSVVTEERVGILSDVLFRKLSLTPTFYLPAHLFWAREWRSVSGRVTPHQSHPTSSSNSPAKKSLSILNDENVTPAQLSENMTDWNNEEFPVTLIQCPPARTDSLDKQSESIDDVSLLPGVTILSIEDLRTRDFSATNGVIISADLAVSNNTEDFLSAYDRLLRQVQTLMTREFSKDDAKLKLVIVNAAASGASAFVKTANLEIAQSPLSSKLWLVSLEMPRAEPLVLIPELIRRYIFQGKTEAKILNEALVRYDESGRFMVARLVKAKWPCYGACELWMSKRGSLNNLKLRPLAKESRVVPGAMDIEATVLSVGLNFRDVLNVMDLYPGEPGLPGADFAGVVTRVGPSETRFQVGESVFGLCPGALQSFVTTPSSLAGRLPKGWSFEQASALPVAQVTVEYAFTDLAGMDPSVPVIDDSRAVKGSVKYPPVTPTAGEPLRVLIHAATGGVGLFAVQYCKRIGAEVYCTCGGDFKKKYLQSLGLKHVTSSRDAIRFAADMYKWLGDKKIDVVLNCLAGGHITTSLDLLKEDGYFLELGKLRTWTTAQVHEVKPKVAYYMIAVDSMVERDCDWFTAQLDRTVALCDAGKVRPIAVRTFHISAGQDAFRFLQKAKHIGKVVVTLPHVSVPEVANPIIDNAPESTTHIQAPRRDSDLDKAVVITGGLGGLGLVIAEWLVCEQLMRNVYLLSRSGKTPVKTDTGEMSTVAEIWDRLQKQTHARVHVVNCDISDADEVDKFFSRTFAEGGVKLLGILHAAGVLDDTPLRAMDSKAFQRPFPAKIGGAMNIAKALDRYKLESDLAFFAMFSSIAALLGNAAQSNYSVANAMLDEFAMERRSRGLKAHSIQWGPWTEQGMAQHLASIIDKIGFRGVTNDVGLRVLGDSIHRQDMLSVLGVESIKWRTYLTQYDQNLIPPFFNAVANDASLSGSRDRLNKDLIALAPEALKDHVYSVVVATAMEVTGRKVNDGLDLDQPITESGIDSLAAVEFGNELSSKLGVKLSPTTLFDYPTLNGIAGYVYEKIAASLAVTLSSKLEGYDDLTSPEISPSVQLNDDLMRSSRAAQLAIVGASCRMPLRSWSMDEFWQMMIDKTDCIKYIPESRFDVAQIYDLNPQLGNRCYVREAGFMEDVELFDARFFNISPSEVAVMDPQQRMWLEVSYECLLDARLNRKSVAGRSIGVYVGCCNFDWHCTDATARCDSTFTSTGIAASIIANRVSYVLGLTGPSCVMDTACSSSLVALDTAFTKLMIDESVEGALVGGVNVIVAPHPFVAFCKTRMLAPDGRCKSFDASANGYGRGEGCGCLYVMPLRQAKGQRVHAVVKGSAVNHDGRSASLTAPNGRAQRAVLAAALNRANVTAADVVYIETHGTGTALGDPIEAAAIRGVYLDSCRSDYIDGSYPLVFGAVKTNIGHLEGAAGVAGLLKAILVLKHKTAPPLVHFKKLNPHIKLEGVKYILSDKSVDLEYVNERRGRSKPKFCVGVSSFGFGGANAHVIVEEPSVSMRSWAVTSSALGTKTKEVGLVFLCTGQGSQSAFMGAQLMDTEPIFKEAVMSTLALFGEPLATEVYDVWLGERARTEPMAINATLYAQLSLFTLEYALCVLLASKKVMPSLILGHSLGEYVAAVVCGIMTLADACTVLRQRAVAMSHMSCKEPVMCAIRDTEENVQRAIEAVYHDSEPRVAIAAINGPKSLVISGDKRDVEEVLVKLAIAPEKARFLSVSNAFHSIHMKEAAAVVHTAVSDITLTSPASDAPCRMISTLTGGLVQPAQVASPDYWSTQILVPVRFASAVSAAAANGGGIFIEIGPKPTLINLGRLAFPAEEASQSHWVASLVPQVDNKQTIEAVVRSVHGDEVHKWNHVALPWPPCRIMNPDSVVCRSAVAKRPVPQDPSEPQTAVLAERREVADFVHKGIRKAAEQAFPEVSLSDFTSPLSETLAAIDSLAAVDFREQLSDQLQMEVPVTILFDHATLEDIQNALVDELLHSNTVGQVMQYSPPELIPSKVNVAVVGIGLSYPNAVTSLDAFWSQVTSQVSPFREIPLERYNIGLNNAYEIDKVTPVTTYSQTAALLDDPGVSFPTKFFKMQSNEVSTCDPQQRLLVKVAYEAFLKAGQNRKTLELSDTSVFVGCSDNEWPFLVPSNRSTNIKSETNAQNSFTGAATCMLANRVSHLLKLRGASMTVDTGCSSFASALYLAVESVAFDRAAIALAAGVSLILTPLTAMGFSQMRYLSAHKRIRTFDTESAGTLRGEGCGAFVLKKMDTCVVEGDKVFAVIRAAAVSSSGGAPNLTAFHTPAQEAAIRKALTQANCAPVDVDFIEAHGTGIALSDAVEFSALRQVFAAGRQEGSEPLHVTSVHPYFGHSNGALGAAQLIKAIATLHHAELPPLMNFVKPHAFLDTRKFNVNIPTSRVALRTSGAPPTALINSFGMGGANGCIVLSRPGAQQVEAQSYAPINDQEYKEAHLDEYKWTTPNDVLALVQLGHGRATPQQDLDAFRSALTLYKEALETREFPKWVSVVWEGHLLRDQQIVILADAVDTRVLALVVDQLPNQRPYCKIHIFVPVEIYKDADKDSHEYRRMSTQASIHPVNLDEPFRWDAERGWVTSVIVLPSLNILGKSYSQARSLFQMMQLFIPVFVDAVEVRLLSSVFTDLNVLYNRTGAKASLSSKCDIDALLRVCGLETFGELAHLAVLEHCLESFTHSHRLTLVRAAHCLDENAVPTFIKIFLEPALRLQRVPDGPAWPVSTCTDIADKMTYWNPEAFHHNPHPLVINAVLRTMYPRATLCRDLARIGGHIQIAPMSEILRQPTTSENVKTRAALMGLRMLAPSFTGVECVVAESKWSALNSAEGHLRVHTVSKDGTMESPTAMPCLDAKALVEECEAMRLVPNAHVCPFACLVVDRIVTSAKQCDLSKSGAMMLRAAILHILQNVSVLDSLRGVGMSALPDLDEDPVFIVGIDRLSNSFAASLLETDKEHYLMPNFAETMAPLGAVGTTRFRSDGHSVLEELMTSNDQWSETLQFVSDGVATLRSVVGEKFHCLFPTCGEDAWEDTLILEMLGLSPSYAMKFQIDNLDFLETHADEAAELHRLWLRVILMLRAARSPTALNGKRVLLTSPYHLLILDSLLKHYKRAKVIFVNAGLDSSIELTSRIADRFQQTVRQDHSMDQVRCLQRKIMTRSLARSEAVLKQLSRDKLFVIEKSVLLRRARAATIALRTFTDCPSADYPPRPTHDFLCQAVLQQLLPHDLDSTNLSRVQLMAYSMHHLTDLAFPHLPLTPLPLKPAPSSELEAEATVAVCAKNAFRSQQFAAIAQWAPSWLLEPPQDPREHMRQLRDSLVPALAKIQPVHARPRDLILVTGSAGFFGRYLLASLLAQESDATLVCLVRGPNPEKRLVSAFKESGLDANRLEECQIMQADLQSPMLGLDEATYTMLASRAKSIFHSAGKVSFLSEYDRMSGPNVDATLELLKFARLAGTPTLHLVSSQAVFPGGTSGKGVQLDGIREDATPTCLLDIPGYSVRGNGYDWAKHICEAICVQASELLNIPLAIYRLPHVYFAHQPLFVNKNDFGPRLMDIVPRLGQISNGLAHFMNTVAADEAAKTLVEISVKKEAAAVFSKSNLGRQVYHLCRGNSSGCISAQEFVALTQRIGFDLEVVDDKVLRETAQRLGIESFALNVYLFISDNADQNVLKPLASDALPNTHSLNLYPQWTTAQELWGLALKQSIVSGDIRPEAAAIRMDGFAILRAAQEKVAEHFDVPKTIQTHPYQRSMVQNEEWYLEPLELLRRDLLRKELSTLGVLTAKKLVRQWFLSLLAMQAAERAHPEIMEMKIAARPVFIVGLNRSGTTYLYHALARNKKAFRAPTLMEMTYPYGLDADFELPATPTSMLTSYAEDPRKEDCDFQLKMTAVPNWTVIHQTQSELPEEDYLIFDYAARSLSFPLAYEATNYHQWLTANNYAKLREGYPVHTRMLKHLQRQRETPRWLIKGPWHMLTIETLFQTYPDATVICLHRSPEVAIPSWLNLVEAYRNNLSRDQDVKIWARREMETQCAMIKRFEEFRRSNPEVSKQQIIDVHFDKLVGDPLNTIKALYDGLNAGEHFDDQTATDLAAFVASDQVYKSSKTLPKHDLAYYSLTTQDIRDALETTH